MEPKLGPGSAPVCSRDVMLEVAGVCAWAGEIEPSSGALGRTVIFRDPKMVCVSSLPILPVKHASRKLGQAGNWRERVKPSWVWSQSSFAYLETLLMVDLLPLYFSTLKILCELKESILGCTDKDIFLKFSASFLPCCYKRLSFPIMYDGECLSLKVKPVFCWKLDFEAVPA